MIQFSSDELPASAVATALRGGRIGILGGSFNPAHAAHRHISLIALRRFKLDQVWWLVSPKNPMKPAFGMASLERRLQHASAVANHPKLFVGAAERALGTQYTIDTLTELTRHFPAASFIWLMGGDSLAQFHLWRRWQDIAALVPLGVVARPGYTVSALCCTAAVRLAHWRIYQASQLTQIRPPVWCMVQERLDKSSATEIRQRGLWP